MNKNNRTFEEKFVNEIEKLEDFKNEFDINSQYENEINDVISQLEEIEEIFKEELKKSVKDKYIDYYKEYRIIEYYLEEIDETLNDYYYKLEELEELEEEIEEELEF